MWESSAVPSKIHFALTQLFVLFPLLPVLDIEACYSCKKKGKRGGGVASYNKLCKIPPHP